MKFKVGDLVKGRAVDGDIIHGQVSRIFLPIGRGDSRVEVVDSALDWRFCICRVKDLEHVKVSDAVPPFKVGDLVKGKSIRGSKVEGYVTDVDQYSRVIVENGFTCSSMDIVLSGKIKCKGQGHKPADYPHKCPHCGAPSYNGLESSDCSAECH